MRRITIRFFISLVLGLVTAVAVAWSCAVLIDLDNVESQPLYGESRGEEWYWWVLRDRTLGKVRLRSYLAPSASHSANTELSDRESPLAGKVAPSWFDPLAAKDRHSGSGDSVYSKGSVKPWGSNIDSYLTISASGWPRPALMLELVYVLNPAGGWTWSADGWTSGVQVLGDGLSDERWLPLIPIWWNLAFDTMFFASLWFLVLSVLHTFRRANRLRRGHCPECSYDLRKQFAAGCPECGWRRER